MTILNSTIIFSKGYRAMKYYILLFLFFIPNVFANQSEYLQNKERLLGEYQTGANSCDYNDVKNYLLERSNNFTEKEFQSCSYILDNGFVVYTVNTTKGTFKFSKQQ